MHRLILASGIVGGSLLTFCFPAAAQIFCPLAAGGQVGIALQAGTCTNGTTGAFSNAALASQSLTELSQTSSQETTRTATNAISDRRRTEVERDTQSQRQAQRTRRTQDDRRRSDREGGRQVTDAKSPVFKAPPPVPMQEPRFAFWGQVFGNVEERSGTFASTINCCTNAVAGGLPIGLRLETDSRTETVGGLFGFDVTTRNLLSQGDGLIAGVLGGYTDSLMNLSVRSISSVPANLANGSANLRAHLHGPSVGAFATYFNGPFSIDNTVKVDFFSLGQRFTDTLAFTVNVLPNTLILNPSIPATFAFSNSGSTRLTNLSTFGNINYKIPFTPAFWIEPTAGYSYSHADYSSSATQLGLADGDLLRLQGGARFGFESDWNSVRVTTVLSGLAYSNVIVSGGAVQNAAFGTGIAVPQDDEGKLRGLGALAFNFDFGNGLTSFVQGQVYGGDNLFGAGGKGGIRFQW